MKKYLPVVFLPLVLSATTALGTEKPYSGTISRLLSSGKQYGGCMVNLPAFSGTAILPGCKANWISLDCNGGYFPGAGERSYSTALAAFSLGRTVTLTVDDTKKYDGYCVASRLDLLSN